MKSVKPGRGPSFMNGVGYVAAAVFGIFWMILAGGIGAPGLFVAFGAIFVLVCDMIGRIVIAPYELPIELIVGILGSLIFIGLLFYRLKYGRKAIRLGSAGTGCCSALPNLKGGADQ